MRTIIAGSRTITDVLEVEKAIKNSGFQITEVLSGTASGPDTIGANWAKEKAIPVKFFAPDWKTHGKAAGPIRNSLMADNAEALILIYDGQSRGSNDMWNKANAKGLKTYMHLVIGDRKVQ